MSKTEHYFNNNAMTESQCVKGEQSLMSHYVTVALFVSQRQVSSVFKSCRMAVEKSDLTNDSLAVVLYLATSWVVMTASHKQTCSHPGSFASVPRGYAPPISIGGVPFQCFAWQALCSTGT
jgi:hypothetical protein